MPAERASTGPLWAAMYHSIADATHDPYRVTVSPGRLDRQLRLLRRRGLRGVSMERLLRARADGSAAGLVGLTFDDGYADFTTHAVPALLRYGFTATVYVLPGRLGGGNEWDPRGPRKPLLTEDGVRAAADAGMEIGSHGLLHTDLTDRDLVDAELLAAETARSRALLEAVTDTRVTGFCYPYGNVDMRAVDAVRAAGYQYAVGIDPGRLTGLFALPRVHVGEEDTAARLLLKLALHRVRREPVPYGPYPEIHESDLPEPGVPGPAVPGPVCAPGTFGPVSDPGAFGSVLVPGAFLPVSAPGVPQPVALPVSVQGASGPVSLPGASGPVSAPSREASAP